MTETDHGEDNRVGELRERATNANEKLAAERKKRLPREVAERELERFRDIGIECSELNIEAVMAQMETPQLPEGERGEYKEIISALGSGDREKLKEEMKKIGIVFISHVEGRSVWDHARLALEFIRRGEGSFEEKRDIALIMLYHDLGKSVVWNTSENMERMRKNINNGQFYQSMKGHAGAEIGNIRRGLQANGVDGSRLELFMNVISHHMETGILNPNNSPEGIVNLVESFGVDDAERMEGVRLLAKIFALDGSSTKNIELGKEDGELHDSFNEFKLKLTFEAMWEKYKEAKMKIRKDSQ